MSSSFLVADPKRKYRLAVVGVGALGSELCRLIAMAGPFEIVLIDPDKLEPRNLRFSKMLQLGCDSLFGNSLHEDELREQFKGHLLVAAAKSFFGQNGWSALTVEIADVNLSIIAGCDLVISCTDSSLSRCETAWIARLLGKGLVDGGLKGEEQHEGRAAWYPPDMANACYLCEIAESRRAEVLSYAVSGSLGCIARPVEAAMDAPPEMTTRLAEQILAIVREAVTNNAETQTPWAHRKCATAWLYRLPQGGGDTRNLSVEQIALTRSVTCPWHEKNPAEQLRVADTEIAIREVLRGLPESKPHSGRMVLELQWPVCLRSRCTVCGAEGRPRRRLGWIRRYGICTQCRTVGAMESLDTVQSFTEDSPAAEMTLGDFGFSAGDLFCFRPEYL